MKSEFQAGFEKHEGQAGLLEHLDAVGEKVSSIIEDSHANLVDEMVLQEPNVDQARKSAMKVLAIRDLPKELATMKKAVADADTDKLAELKAKLDLLDSSLDELAQQR